MTFPRELFAFAAMVLVSTCKADYPPARLSYEWLDPFTVNVSWERPSGLPDSTEVQYKYCRVKNGADDYVTLTVWRNFTEMCLTEDMTVDGWTYSVWTVSSPPSNSNSNNGSTRVPLTIKSRKPRAEVVKDFKCFISFSGTNCSWIPVNRSLELTLSYRTCGLSKQLLKGLKKCDQTYSSGMRNGCHLQIDAAQGDICIHVDSEAGMSTFKAVPVVPSPKMTITEEGDNLKLSWIPPEVGKACDWTYSVCYKQCNRQKECQNGNSTLTVSYDRNCLYEFQSSVRIHDNCMKVFSDFSDVVTYGTNKPPDWTMTVVAILIPIILSVCVLLSCYCFRRHSAIICPTIPDPSAIFKEMMMSGNKELKATTGSLYTLVPEPIEPCEITLITKDSVLQQNV